MGMRKHSNTSQALPQEGVTERGDVSGPRLWQSSAAACPNSSDTSEAFQRLTACERAAAGSALTVGLKLGHELSNQPVSRPAASEALSPLKIRAEKHKKWRTGRAFKAVNA